MRGVSEGDGSNCFGIEAYALGYRIVCSLLVWYRLLVCLQPGIRELVEDCRWRIVAWRIVEEGSREGGSWKEDRGRRIVEGESWKEDRGMKNASWLVYYVTNWKCF